MTYNLEQLGPTGFQDLAAALAKAALGPGIEAMGRGRDGGRDLVFTGRIVWTGDFENPGEVWDGHSVFQVKHKAELAPNPLDNAKWLWGEIRDELALWADPTGDRNPLPDNLAFVTNVALSPFPDAGGRDEIRRKIAAYIDRLADGSRDVSSNDDGAQRRARLDRLSTIKNWKFWHATELQTLLNVHESVRRAFNAFLTPADVFASLAQFTDKLPLEKLEPALRAHAQTTLMGDGYLYFDEAGSGDQSPIPIHQVAIDLPVRINEGLTRTTVLKYVLQRAERVLKPSITSKRGPRHLLITGAPGNGKTTISRFLVQTFRAAMLDGGPLSADQGNVIRGTGEALARFGCSMPKNRRWPMRIDLAKYAEEGGLQDEATLVRWIAQKVSERSNEGTLTPQALNSWMRQWPTFIVLDGLDEVTEPKVRKRLIERVTEFVNDAESSDMDVLVILTTRPIGYTENIAPNHFERIDLDYLQLDDAVRYGSLATKVRLRNDAERINTVIRRLTEAAKDDALKWLLRTPLQVLIVTIIVENSAQLAPDRYSLFWSYYETVVRRELSKDGTGLQLLLREHRPLIEQLHQRVGFELQLASESADRSYATLSRDELKGVAWKILVEAGFDPSIADRDLLEGILKTATHRLVLIAPRGDNDGYGFDVRSLQELMAAVYLTVGSPQRVSERLLKAAPNPHWRNTWIFTAGRIFSLPQPEQHEALVSLVESVDEDASQRLGHIVPVGPRLALGLIDDGMVRSVPRWRDRLIRHALKTLAEPSSADFAEVVTQLVHFADTGRTQLRLISEGLRDALAGTPTAQRNAQTMQELVPQIVAETSAKADVLGVRLVLKRPTDQLSPLRPNAWDMFQEEISTYPASTVVVGQLLESSASALRDMAQVKYTVEEVDTVVAALSELEAAAVLSSALRHVSEYEPKLVGVLRDYVLPSKDRAPIGEELR